MEKIIKKTRISKKTRLRYKSTRLYETDYPLALNLQQKLNVKSISQVLHEALTFFDKSLNQ